MPPGHSGAHSPDPSPRERKPVSCRLSPGQVLVAWLTGATNTLSSVTQPTGRHRLDMQIPVHTSTSQEGSVFSPLTSCFESHPWGVPPPPHTHTLSTARASALQGSAHTGSTLLPMPCRQRLCHAQPGTGAPLGKAA